MSDTDSFFAPGNDSALGGALKEVGDAEREFADAILCASHKQGITTSLERLSFFFSGFFRFSTHNTIEKAQPSPFQ